MMGKTHRFSKGHPLGFVPDYRHGVETVGESKGIESPPRIDSGTSSAPLKRKCTSVKKRDGEGASGFNVPREVFQLQTMTALDRKDLETRLRNELARVRALQNRLLSRGAAASMDCGAMSAPGGDAPLLNKKGDKLKRSSSLQSVRGVPPLQDPPVISSANYTASFRQCANLLKNLMTHIWAHPFLAPVDVVKLNIPDYFDHIKCPMDLGTVKKKLNAGMYSTPRDFAADVRLTFSNAMTYNPVNNDVHIMAKKLNKDFETRWRLIEKKLPQPDEKPPPVREPITKNANKRSTIEKEVPAEKKPSKKGASKKDIVQKEDLVHNPVLLPKKRKASPVQNAPAVVSVVPTRKQIMTDEQKLNLSARLESYGAFPEHILEFIKSHAPHCDGSDEVLELDMGALSDDVLFELQKLVHDYDRANQSRNHTKEDPHPHEAESQSHYELVNSSGHHEEDNGLIDEDVDIGENDLPVLSHPPVVFEDEMADRSSKHSTSSSSSSDSESSSSGSDSSCSSGSDLDVKGLQQNGSPKENVLPVDIFDQEKDSLKTPNPPEQSVDPIPVPAEREGGNVSENQEQIRRALLRKRFADTILKAHEKTLDQVTQKDPEKLRREREELERLQREERARLQAEAKAAEDARKRAETAAAAEAAAEAKRQRELEREAARKALQEMEKTVDINEGSLFLKDLEMLGSVTGEQLPIPVGETSPTHMPEALGFEMGGNALEKLGLFMKNDDDEDEEGDPTDGPAADVEEGEID